MRCPILIMGRMNSSDPRDISFTDCLLAECAWWDELGRCCGEKSKKIQLERITEALSLIEKHMPTTGQFLK